jgi:hypothetical protein
MASFSRAAHAPREPYGLTASAPERRSLVSRPPITWRALPLRRFVVEAYSKENWYPGRQRHPCGVPVEVPGRSSERVTGVERMHCELVIAGTE